MNAKNVITASLDDVKYLAERLREQIRQASGAEPWLPQWRRELADLERMAAGR